MTPSSRPPRYRVCVYELRDGKTTEVINTYGTGFITAVATLDGDDLEVHFGEGGPRHLQRTSQPQSPTNTLPAAGANSIP